MGSALAASGLSETFATFVVSLLVGGMALTVGERLVVGKGDLQGATLTAALGAVAWAIVDGVPLLGTVLALGVWLAILHWRFDAGWFGTALIGGVAWITAVVTVSIGTALGLPLKEAIGIPAT